MREEANADNVNCKVKLPKLLLTKFHGTQLDWFCFWNQFESDIEKSELFLVSTFSYLKELVSSRVQSLIDRLCFTTEGYTRAKNILVRKYCKYSEVANTLVQSMSRPTSINLIPERSMNLVRSY